MKAAPAISWDCVVPKSDGIILKISAQLAHTGRALGYSYDSKTRDRGRDRNRLMLEPAGIFPMTLVERLVLSHHPVG
jgi:hypothetical protein